MLSAHGKDGARTTINNNSPPAVRRRRTEGGKRFRNSALAEYQNRKIFVSLIEKNFCEGTIKKCLENFSVLLAEAKRRRAETLGGIVALRATIKNQRPDFRQKKFGF